MTMSSKEIVAYVMWKLGCTHPFRISRLLLLAEYSYRETYGKALAEDLTYRGADFGFYIEELPRIIEEYEKSGCIERDERRRCLKFTCNPPSLSGVEKKLLDKIIDETRKLEDKQLNKLVLHHPLYSEIVKEMR